jgi:EAL domain-containing protein (putative c-di-GMP-specific phosphodiesterase class I)
MRVELPAAVAFADLDDAARPVALPAFAYAFQPIVNTRDREVHSYEALIRGPEGQPAWSVLERVSDADLAEFDEVTRNAAVSAATRLGITTSLNLNCLPRSLQRPIDAVDGTLAVAERCGVEASRIILEVTETEMVHDRGQFARNIDAFRSAGVRIAIDDFGAGYSGLNLLVELQPDVVKLDMHLIRGIERHGPRQAIVRAVMSACVELGIDVIAEGVETIDELSWCETHGIWLFQGYYFARPGFDCLPSVDFT